MTCSQCADTGQYDWFDTLNERATSVICLCSAGTALLRKQALARVEKYGHVSMGTPIATLATSRIVHDELVRDGLIEEVRVVGIDSAARDSWRLTEKGRTR